MYVVITGASRGIGKALAYKFAEHKYNLILTCEKNIKELEIIKQEIESKYNINVIIKMGLIEETDIKDIDDIYILINNAGKCDYNMLIDVSYEKYKQITYSNLDYLFLTTKLLLKKMLKNKNGIILNVSSIWGLVGSSMEVIYSMTKGGVNAFTKALSKELFYSNIDVIGVALGMVDTDMNKHFSNDEMTDIKNNLVDKRMFEIDEIADKIYNLLLNREFKTGEIIEINNGLV